MPMHGCSPGLWRCRVPEECPAEVERAVNACRQLDAGARPTALDICNLIEASAPRSSLSSDGSLQPGGHCASYIQWYLRRNALPCCNGCGVQT